MDLLPEEIKRRQSCFSFKKQKKFDLLHIKLSLVKYRVSKAKELLSKQLEEEEIEAVSEKKSRSINPLIQKEYIQRNGSLHNGTVFRHCEPRQDNRRASYFEFLFEQFKFIKKRWWACRRNPVSAILLADSDGGRADTGAMVIFSDDHYLKSGRTGDFLQSRSKNGILFTAPDLCCKDIAICSSGSGYDYSFFQYFSLYTTDFSIPDHHRFSSAA